mgnify:CR=1 FL=1
MRTWGTPFRYSRSQLRHVSKGDKLHEGDKVILKGTAVFAPPSLGGLGYLNPLQVATYCSPTMYEQLVIERLRRELPKKGHKVRYIKAVGKTQPPDNPFMNLCKVVVEFEVHVIVGRGSPGVIAALVLITIIVAIIGAIAYFVHCDIHTIQKIIETIFGGGGGGQPPGPPGPPIPGIAWIALIAIAIVIGLILLRR